MSSEHKPDPGAETNHWVRPSFLLRCVLACAALAGFYSLARSPTPAELLQVFGLSLLFMVWVSLTLILCLDWLQRGSSRARLTSHPAMVVVLAVLLTFILSLTVIYLDILDLGSLAPWFLARNVLIALLVSGALAIATRFYLQWRLQIQEEAAYRLQSLQARIRPHFLFNALNTIASLIHDRPDRAEEATVDLADLLRTGLKSDQAHGLADELDLIQRYLRLEALRLEDRLRGDWQLADNLPLEQSLPPLLLQPLVENAIVHGISRRASGGTLRIEAQRIRFARLRFTITNPLPDPGTRPTEGNRSALDNIRQRLALAYEERYGLKTWTDGDCFKAELTIPVS